MADRAISNIRNHMYNFFSHSLSPALLASISVSIITIVALFIPPYIGMADNGDYFRILYSNGLYFNDPDYSNQYLGYFVKSFGIFQYYNENGATLFTSQTIFIKLSLWINQLFTHDNVFDIRFQAAIYVVLYAIAVYLFVESVTWKCKRKQSYIIAAIAVFVFGDTGYTAYFNSFYSEGLVLIMSMLVFSSGVLLYRNRYNDYVLLFLFGISTLLLTTSKQQNAPIGIILGLFSIFLLFVRKSKSFRAVISIMMASFLIAGVCSYILIPKDFVNINKYHAMTRGVLLNSPDPEATLEHFGIDKQFAVLRGTIYYSPYTTIDVNSELMQEQFYNKFSFGSILAYYISRPTEFNKMLNLAAANGYTIRPSAMGNFEKSENRPFGQHTYFFSGYSFLKKVATPKTFGFVVIWIIIVAGMYIPAFISAIRNRQLRQAFRLPIIVAMIAIALSSMVIAIVGAGDADLAKHEFLFTVMFDLITFLTFSDLISRRIWQNESL
ncbi:hypothetical protein [Paenibacillus sp. HB172176]|uniref:glycan biosynthesis hexose transferase WsfD n=1 Tax=Paenibacillus sp. HB172176 TaxID=2493690 RepID=UPI00197E08C5|nr:hypothetical protein [Paenibacillus sp. HB172176]